MEKRVLTVNNSLGLHARPAAAFSKIAQKYPCTVRVTARDTTVNGKSIVGILKAGIVCGTQIDLETEGQDEKAAIEELETFINNGCGEN